jgi:hypothetical protein
MSTNLLENVLLILIFVWPAFILPILIGPIILRVFRRDNLRRLAGLFTLKPVLATPLWAAAYLVGDTLTGSYWIGYALSMLPALVLTLLIVRSCRQAFATDRSMALLLLAGDAVRWLNTLAWQVLSEDIGFSTLDPYYLAGLILPNLYALMALILLWVRARNQTRLESQALERLAS